MFLSFWVAAARPPRKARKEAEANGVEPAFGPLEDEKAALETTAAEVADKAAAAKKAAAEAARDVAGVGSDRK